MLPGIGVAFPGLAARFAGGRNGVGPPEPLAGIRIKRINVSARTLVAAAAADDELVVDQQRSRGQGAVGSLGIVEYDRPDEFAGIGFRPIDLAVGGDGNDKVLVERDTAVRG